MFGYLFGASVVYERAFSTLYERLETRVNNLQDTGRERPKAVTGSILDYTCG